MKKYLFRLECLTDMHVGSGEAKYSMIDNEVQKDTVLKDVPIIHASGVKGALKEHFEERMSKEKIFEIFGGVEKCIENEVEKKKPKEGGYKFFTAICLARPLRVTNGDHPYILTTGIDVLKSFSTLLKGLELSTYYEYHDIELNDGFVSNAENIEIEGIKAQPFPEGSPLLEQLKKLIGQNFAVAKSMRDYDLPTRARNQLENGQSKHLWYEELVPHKSVFYFVIITPGDSCELDFEKAGPVHFGGNATIGNGYTKIKEVFSS
jgi:CRISPR-associated protein Cmr4